MALNPLERQAVGAERFAIDYVQMSPDGTIYRGDASKPESYPYFGRHPRRRRRPRESVVVSTDCPNRWQGQSPTGLPLDRVRRKPRRSGHRRRNYAF